MQSSAVERFKPTGTQGASMKVLNDVRNDFIHFTPKGWSLDLSDSPQLAIDCLDVSEFLVSSSGRFCLFTGFKEGELVGLIHGLKKDFAAMK